MVAEQMLLISMIVLIAIVTSIVLVLQLQRHQDTRLSARRVEWENVQKRSQQIWETQQEKHAIELEHSLVASVQHMEQAWKVWEAKDRLLIASTAQQYETALAQMWLEQELARLPRTYEVPLKKPI
ncbi:MAG: hypothetical protein NVS4B11_38440 [Ktedonobacteraceae bacterium]